MSEIAVYHWWDEPGDSPPYANLRIPTIISIATLRAANPNIPILVLDLNERETHWGGFTDKLWFSVRKIQPCLKKHKDRIRGWKHLSRFSDVHREIRQGTILYVDSDVFWLQDPLPLEKSPDKFCFDGWNTGFYYYDRTAPFTEDFFEIFEAYTRGAIYSDDVRKVMKKYVGYDSWHGVWDEMMSSYMAHQHPELFNIIPVNEHTAARNLHLASNPKMFHCNGTMVSNEVPKTPNEQIHCRGLLGLLVMEIYEKLRKVLDQQDIDQIYSLQEQRRYMPQQFPLRRICETKGKDGHFYVEKCLVRGNLI